MLALTRLKGEQIIIGTGPDAVIVTVSRIDRGKVVLAITAPQHVQVDRMEVRLAKDAGRTNREPTNARMPDQSSTLLEAAAEILDPVKWAAMMLTKEAPGVKTVGQAMDMIESVVRKAIDRAVAMKGEVARG